MQAGMQVTYTGGTPRKIHGRGGLQPVGTLDVPYPIPSYPPGQGMGYAKGYVPGYGVKHTLHYSFVLVFYECAFHHTLGPGCGEHTLWRRVHTLIPGYIPGYGTSKTTADCRVPEIPLLSLCFSVSASATPSWSSWACAWLVVRFVSGRSVP